MEKLAVLSAVNKGAFWERLCHLYMKMGDYVDMENLENRSVRYIKVFLSDKENQYGQLLRSQLWTEYLSRQTCTVTDIPPLDGSKISLFVVTSDTDDCLSLRCMRQAGKEAGRMVACEWKDTGIGISHGIQAAGADCTGFGTFTDVRHTGALHLKVPESAGSAYGVCMTGGSERGFFISVAGGADGYGESGYDDDTGRCLGRLLGNIGLMLGEEGATMKDIACFTVYLRDLSDYPETDRFMNLAFPDIPRVILNARLRSPEHTFGIECVAVLRK